MEKRQQIRQYYSASAAILFSALRFRLRSGEGSGILPTVLPTVKGYTSSYGFSDVKDTTQLKTAKIRESRGEYAKDYRSIHDIIDGSGTYRMQRCGHACRAGNVNYSIVSNSGLTHI